MCSITFDWRENDAMRKVKMFEKTRDSFCGELLWATVEFTELCNHKCIYCYENAGPRKNYSIIKKKEMEKLISYMGEQGIKQLTCSGGEPLMYPYIKEAVKLAKDNGMVVHMITNGYFLTKKVTKELYKNGLTQVQINIDSANPKKHDRIRGKLGSFKHAVQALKNAQEVGMTCVSQTVLTNMNENEIVEIFKIARSIGVQRCRVWDIVPSEGRALSNMHLKPRKNYIQTIKKIAEFAVETGAINIESGDPLFHHRVYDKLPITGGYCPYAIGILANLSVGGDSYFCCTNRGKPMYNIFELMTEGKSLKVSHYNTLKIFLKKMQMKKLDEKCEKCRFFDTCKGGCYMRRIFNNFRSDYWCLARHDNLQSPS